MQILSGSLGLEVIWWQQSGEQKLLPPPELRLGSNIPGRKPPPPPRLPPSQQVFARWAASSIWLNRNHQIPRAAKARARPHGADTERIYWYPMTRFQWWWMHLLPTFDRGWTAWSRCLMNYDCCVQLKSVFLQVKQQRTSLKNRLVYSGSCFWMF